MTHEILAPGVTIYLGDCLQILPALGKVDAVVADPPYGVNLGEAGTGQERERGQTGYTDFSDNQEYLLATVIPAIQNALSFSQRAMITPGNKNAWLYPKPDDVGVWYNPAGAGRSKWGFVLAHLILYYGRDPNAGRSSSASSVWGLCDSVAELKNISHPCPKPLLFVQWMLGKCSKKDELVLDPFMGSGTTGVAAVKLGRKFIGVEISETYYQIARQRLIQAIEEKSMDMFADQEPEVFQHELL